MSTLVPTPPQTLSFSRTLACPNAQLFLLRTGLSHLSLRHTPRTTPIRMGGGPRTYPGGVSKWQWKRMQKNKAKQLLKARLCRERQIYEMRKRAELQAAVSELERPWEAVEKAPRLLSVTADDQLMALADRFQRPEGFDMWTDRDGPQVFGGAEAELPSARFFPKGVVHSVKPYGRIGDGKDDELDGSSGTSGGGAIAPWNGGYRGRKSHRVRQRGTIGTETYSGSDSVDSDGENMSFQESVEASGMVAMKNEKEVGVGLRKGGDRRRDHSGSNVKDHRRVGINQKESSGMVAVKNEKEGGVGLRKGGDRRRDHSGFNVKDHRRVGINQKESSGMVAVKNEKEIGFGLRKGGDRRRDHSGSNVRDHRRGGINQKKRGESYSSRARGSRIGEIIEGLKKPRDSVSEVYDMSLGQDGSYGL